MQRPRTLGVLGSLFPSSRRRTATPSRPAVERRRTVCTEPLEERLMMALSKAGGGSGYSGTLSTNPTIRQQQLICDPAPSAADANPDRADQPAQGSTSVRYDATQVTLDRFESGPGYTISQVFVGVEPTQPPIEGPPPGPSTVTFDEFKRLQKAGAVTESGYVQITYSQPEVENQHGQMFPPEGYSIDDEEGVEGVDTHALYFDLLGDGGVIGTTDGPGLTADAVANPGPTGPNITYTVFAAHEGEFGNQHEDFLVTQAGEYIGPDEISPATVSSNDPPVIECTGGPYYIDEGCDLDLSGTASRQSASPDDIRYAWDIGDDGFIDATGRDATVSAADLALLGLGDGPKTVPVRLIVGGGLNTTTALTTLTVKNVAPDVCVDAAPGCTISGHATINLTASDWSAADEAAGFNFLIDWGDGSGQQVITPTPGNGSGTLASHDYGLAGLFTVTVKAVDKDGGVSAPDSGKILVGSGAELRPDPSDPSKLALYVIGTSGNDVIRFGETSEGHTVRMNSQVCGPFDGFERIIVLAGDGADDVRMPATYGHDALFFGGGGNDFLSALSGSAIVDGGPGDDQIATGSEADLLIGGAGADNIKGGGGQDILVAGRSSFDGGSDNDVRDLTAILTEWALDTGYVLRISHITGATGGGANGTAVLRLSGAGQNVFDDGAVDTVNGGAGRDWLVIHSGTGGDITDLALNETASNV